MAVSRARSVERSRWAWFPNRLPACVAWLQNDVLACWDLAVVWLKTGARAPADPWNWACPPRFLPEVRDGEEGFLMVAGMLGVDPHKASHTAVAIGVAEEPLGELRVRACAA